jgi:hypothetical protein
LVKARVTIITITLMTVATTDKRMMNREKERCWLKAMRWAINAATILNWILSE